MVWVLLIVVTFITPGANTQSTISMTSAEYFSESACNAGAQKLIDAMAPNPAYTVSYGCSPKLMLP